MHQRHRLQQRSRLIPPLPPSPPLPLFSSLSLLTKLIDCQRESTLRNCSAALQHRSSYTLKLSLLNRSQCALAMSSPWRSMRNIVGMM